MEAVMKELEVGVEEQGIPTMWVVADVVLERRRQRQRWGQQDLLDGTGNYVHDPKADAVVREAQLRFREKERGAAQLACDALHREARLTYLDILREVFLEIAAEENPARLKRELVQLAAVAVQWVEKLNREGVR
jgi:hypothetical protein